MDIDVKELIKAAVEGFDLSNFKGDVVGVKVVENEIGNVEQGGIGIQINNGAKTAPQTQSDKNIKAAVEELLKAKEGDGLVFSNKKQWWAVYKVLKEFCNYPAHNLCKKNCFFCIPASGRNRFNITDKSFFKHQITVVKKRGNCVAQSGRHIADIFV